MNASIRRRACRAGAARRRAPASAMTIEKIVSPSGIEAWLVREQYACRWSRSITPSTAAPAQDEPDKSGTANLAADLLDEGAGDLDGKTFHERLENHAIELALPASRATISTARCARSTNTATRPSISCGLALGAPRFDADAVERVRGQMLAIAAPREHQSEQPRQPPLVADGVPRSPLRPRKQGHAGHRAAHHRRRHARLCRPRLRAQRVDDLDRRRYRRQDRRRTDRPRLRRPAGEERSQAGRKRQPAPASAAASSSISTCRRRWSPSAGRASPATIPISWPATWSITSWAAAPSRRGSISEVREKRGLAYGVSDSLVWFRRAAVVLGGTATRADRTADALAIVEAETKRMAENGPTADELAAAKSFLKGAYALVARHVGQDRRAAHPDPARQSRHRLYPDAAAP